MAKAKSPVKRSPPVEGGRWNHHTSMGPTDRGICCFVDAIPHGHGGRSGYLTGNGFGLACCERHGKSDDAAARGLVWRP